MNGDRKKENKKKYAFWLEPLVYEKFKEYCEEKGISMSSFLNSLLANLLNLRKDLESQQVLTRMDIENLMLRLSHLNVKIDEYLKREREKEEESRVLMLMNSKIDQILEFTKLIFTFNYAILGFLKGIYFSLKSLRFGIFNKIFYIKSKNIKIESLLKEVEIFSQKVDKNLTNIVKSILKKIFG